MREKLINYIDTLFADASATKENLELKEEIMHNTDVYKRQMLLIQFVF